MAALNTKQVALTTTAAVVVAASNTSSIVKIKNNHATIVVFVGKAGVTSATGYRLAAAGGEVTLEFADETPAIYAVGASGTPAVDVLRYIK